MAQRMFHESGQDGRSVLGTLAVQVERDPKTGITVVRSVTPVSPPADAQTATTVFDDGRKSIHAVGGVGGQPSSEELGQILSVIDGVGMKVLLDEAEVTPHKTETKMKNEDVSRAPKGEVSSFSGCHAVSEEDNMKSESAGSYNVKAEPVKESYALSTVNKEDSKQEISIAAVKDNTDEVDNVNDQTLVEGPVTLLFLGYADATTDQGDDQGDDGGMITVERVMITEEGEEHVIGPEGSAQDVKESQDKVLQDIPLEENGAGSKVQGKDGEKVLQDPASPPAAEGEATSKRKTCKCCSVM